MSTCVFCTDQRQCLAFFHYDLTLASGGKAEVNSSDMTQFRTGVCLLLLLLSCELGWCQANTPSVSATTVFAVADVHGDFRDFVAILQRTGLIDGQRHWTGCKATLVQTGDLLDRGPQPREVMDLLMSLEKEAAEAGGQVVGLIGNHEMMNIMGDLRYVTAGNFASFADSESKKRQKAAYQKYESWRKGHSELLAEVTQSVLPKTETEWLAQHPEGYVEQREAFSSGGSYGKWLRLHSAVAKISNVVFLHGGISPKVAKMKLDQINSRIANEIKSFDEAMQYLEQQKIILPFFNLKEITAVVQAQISVDRKSSIKRNTYHQRRLIDFLEYRNWLSVRPDGPLWFRGYNEWTDEQGAPQLNRILKVYGADHIVVGHTVQNGGRMRSRFDGKVFLIDTGMLSSYYKGGRASAWEFRGTDEFFAHYIDQQNVQLEPTKTSMHQDSPVHRGGCADSWDTAIVPNVLALSLIAQTRQAHEFPNPLLCVLDTLRE
jgi:hypothetical protein